jgi:FixJ family two-component response regulator
MADKTVFIVSEDPAIRDLLSELVVAAGLRAQGFEGGPNLGRLSALLLEDAS